jgi:hypothetical protein
MTDYILEAINSSIQAYISALTGRQFASISHNPQRNEHYEEFIGAKKHLVLGVLSHAGGSTAFING